jgi:hypothetical protein
MQAFSHANTAQRRRRPEGPYLPVGMDSRPGAPRVCGIAVRPLPPRRQRAGVPTFFARGRGARVGDWRLKIEDFRGLALRNYSTEWQVALNRESCVLEDAHRQAAANVATGAHGDGDRQVTLRVPQGKMAS